MLRILFICPQKAGSGNFTTVGRISSHLRSLGHHVDVVGFDDSTTRLHLSDSSRYSTVFVIHAYKSVRVLNDLRDDVSLILMFGGTDLNHHLNSTEDTVIMGRVVRRARYCVAFSHTMKSMAARVWAEHAHKIQVIHQGVTTSPSGSFNLRSYLSTKYGYKAQEKIITLVAGIRPVKDPLYLLKDYANSALCRNTSFVIVGPVIDEEYGKDFVAQTEGMRTSNIIYAGELSLPEAHAAIQQSFCLVNSSTSEGMSGAILEAFDLEVPVLARDIPGNSYLIELGVTGLLYQRPQEFLEQLSSLLMFPENKAHMVANAKDSLRKLYSADKEKLLYGKLLGDA